MLKNLELGNLEYKMAEEFFSKVEKEV